MKKPEYRERFRNRSRYMLLKPNEYGIKINSNLRQPAIITDPTVTTIY
jgi:hypothetical protein